MSCPNIFIGHLDRNVPGFPINAFGNNHEDDSGITMSMMQE
jgi:hypothetical protein